MSTYHPSVYLCVKWTPPTMCTASSWGFDQAPLSSFNHSLTTPSSYSEWCYCLIFTLAKLPMSSSFYSSFTDCSRVSVVRLKTWCWCRSPHSVHSRLVQYTPATVRTVLSPRGCITLPFLVWKAESNAAMHHLLKSHLLRHLHEIILISQKTVATSYTFLSQDVGSLS